MRFLVKKSSIKISKEYKTLIMILNIVYAILACLCFKLSYVKTQSGYEVKIGFVVSTILWIMCIGLRSYNL